MSLFIAPKTLLISLDAINGTLERIERHLSALLDLEREAYRTQRNNLHEDETYRQTWINTQAQWRLEDRKHLDAWIATQNAWRQEDIARGEAAAEEARAMLDTASTQAQRFSDLITLPEPPTVETPAVTQKRRPRKAVAQQEVTPEQSEAINEMARLGQEAETE